MVCKRIYNNELIKLALQQPKASARIIFTEPYNKIMLRNLREDLRKRGKDGRWLV